eukprot:jgi/Chlat1/6940/Chrsp52S06607
MGCAAASLLWWWVAAVAAGLLSQGGAAADSRPCTWRDPVSGVRYDLSPLQAKAESAGAGHYVIKSVAPQDLSHDSAHVNVDHDDAVDPNMHHYGLDGLYHIPAEREKYDYYINVCANVHHKPRVCLGKPDAPAYQIVSDQRDSYVKHWHNPACFVLGSLRNMTWALADPGRPDAGVKITYHDGEACLQSYFITNGTGHQEEHWRKIPRQMSLKLVCDERPPKALSGSKASDPMLGAYAHEPSMCAYEVVWPTPLACPVVHSFSLSSLSSLLAFFLLALLAVALTGGVLIAAAAAKHRNPTRWATRAIPMLVRGDKDAWRDLGATLRMRGRGGRRDTLPVMKGM